MNTMRVVPPVVLDDVFLADDTCRDCFEPTDNDYLCERCMEEHVATRTAQSRFGPKASAWRTEDGVYCVGSQWKGCEQVMGKGSSFEEAFSDVDANILRNGFGVELDVELEAQRLWYCRA